MIRRFWRGWTTAENADAYETRLLNTILPGIRDRNIPGYEGAEVWRRALPDGRVEFVTVMTFQRMEDVTGFMGEDYETAHVPDIAQAVLDDFDQVSAHYQVLKTNA